MRPTRPGAALRLPRARRRRRFGRLLLPLLLVIGYLAWPYLTLWRLDQALVGNDQAVLARLIDLTAIRGAIRRQLNKESSDTIEPPSDAFIAWLEQGIRRGGTAALEREVNLAWVRERMLGQSPPGAGLYPVLVRAFFDDPLHFSLRLGTDPARSVRVRLGFTGIGWRVQGLSY